MSCASLKKALSPRKRRRRHLRGRLTNFESKPALFKRAFLWPLQSMAAVLLSRMLTIPTILTLARLVVLPLLVWLILTNQPWAAFGLYVLGALTDFLDGYLARKLDQITPFGTFLDPIADKIYVCAIFVALVANGVLSGVALIAVIIIFSREFLISGLREFLGPYNVQMPVTKLAKWKTATQMLATGALLLVGALPFIDIAGLALLYIAAVLTVITGYSYMKTGLAAMKTLDKD